MSLPLPIVLPLLLACSGSSEAPVQRPANVPAEAADVRFKGEQIELDGEPLLSWSELSSDSARLVLPNDALWISAPGTARWTDVRRILDSTDGPFWLSDLSEATAFGPYDKKPRGTVVAHCPNGPYPIERTHQRLTLEVDADSTQSWVTATVRFLPVIDKDGTEVVANLFQDSCWKPSDCGECEPRSAPESIRVAGPEGCFLPLGKGFRGHTAWREELKPRLAALGFDGDTDVLVTASEQVPYGAVVSLLQGVQDAGITPRLGLVPMGSGSGAPMCDTEVQTPEQLAAAADAWYQDRNARVARGTRPSSDNPRGEP